MAIIIINSQLKIPAKGVKTANCHAEC